MLDAGISVISFQRLELNSVTSDPIGDVDVETDKAIIEVTLRDNGKIRPLNKLRSHKQLNPYAKPVILYARKYGWLATMNAQKAGFLVARSKAELLTILASLP